MNSSASAPQLDVQETRSIEPFIITGILWAMMLLFSLIHATDLRDWTENSTSMGPESIAAQVSHGLVDMAALTGLVHVKTGIEGIRTWVNEPVIWGERQEQSPIVKAPPLKTPQSPPVIRVDAPKPPAQTPVQSPQVAAPLPVEQVSAKKPSVKRVLLVGASSMRHEFGSALERRIGQYEGVKVKRFAKAATGLSRPDVFDWPKKLRALVRSFKPDLVIANHGGNDGQNLPLPKNDRAVWGTPKWKNEYMKRTAEFIGIARQGGARFINVGMPVMRSKRFSKKMRQMNQITKEGTEEVGGIYLETWDLAADAKGNYQEAVIIGKKRRLLRQPDGIHYSVRGGAYVVDKFMPRLLEHVTFGTGQLKKKK